MSDIVEHIQCPACAARGKDTDEDNLAVFETGWKYCIVCEHKEAPDGEPVKRKEVAVTEGSPLLKGGEVVGIADRGLKADTCRKYGVKVQKGAHIYPYIVNGTTVFQKIRLPPTEEKPKDFRTRGDPADARLFGEHLFKPGKRIVVTEGELDCLSVFQALAQRSEWPVVSIRVGAQDGDKAKKVEEEIKRSFEFLNGFEEIVFCFDNDDPGQNSAKAAAALFPPGKVKITQLRYNDPSEYLQKRKSQELYDDLWASPAYRLDGVVDAADVDHRSSIGHTLRYTSPILTMRMLGRKMHTMTGLVSGTGSGKTTMLYQQTNQDLADGVRVGGIFLEGTPAMTLNDLAGIRMGVPVRKILAQRELIAQHPELEEYVEYEDNLDDDELDHIVNEIKSGKNFHLLDHFGRAQPDEILKSIEYLSTGLGCEEIILDHISKIQVADNKELDAFVDGLQSMTKRLPSHLTIVSQLNQGDSSKTHEQGKRTTLRDIRGSQVLVSSFDEILAFSRNQTAEDEDKRNTIFIDSLKNRLGGYTGFIECRKYDPLTGRLSLVEGATPNFAESTEDFDVENLHE